MSQERVLSCQVSEKQIMQQAQKESIRTAFNDLLPRYKHESELEKTLTPLFHFL